MQLACQQDGRRDVDPHVARQSRRFEFQRRVGFEHRRAVDHAGDLAQPGGAFVQHDAHTAFDGEVALDRASSPPDAPDIGDRGQRARARAGVMHGDVEAIARQSERDLAPDPVRGPRDKSHRPAGRIAACALLRDHGRGQCTVNIEPLASDAHLCADRTATPIPMTEPDLRRPPGTAGAALPDPRPDALAHSERLVAALGAEIRTKGGWIGFDRYMQRALSRPGLAYYAAKPAKIGVQGDFVTSPEISPLLARALASQVAQAFSWLLPRLLEFGAGSGALAQDLMLELARLRCEPESY